VENTRAVRLLWGTVSETNNFGFYVQHRDSSTQTFADLPESFVPGHGTTLIPPEYSWTHGNVAGGIHYYRLRQIDLDGSVHFTDQVSVTIDVPTNVTEQYLPDQLLLSQNYPNPFNPTTTITYQNPRPGRVVLKVFSEIGEEISTLVDEVQAPGTYSAVFSTLNDRSRLASGAYFYRIETGDHAVTRKMMLMQ
jgi:hypothetical protein